MAISIVGKPGHPVLSIGQDIVFSVTDTSVLATHVNVRYFCEIYVGSGDASSPLRVATLKTTPNALGVGMFNISDVLESFLGTDRTIDNVSTQTRMWGLNGRPDAPIHYVTEATRGANNTIHTYVRLYTKGSVSVSDNLLQVGAAVTSTSFVVNNIYPEPNTLVTVDASGDAFIHPNDYGFYHNNSSSNLLTDMPSVIHARSTDVGVVAVTTGYQYRGSFAGIQYFLVTFLNSSGAGLGTKVISIESHTGGTNEDDVTGEALRLRTYFGCYPGNISQHYDLPAGTASYTFQGKDATNVAKTKIYTVILQEECKYEITRVCWLNNYGSWDYYNFNVKSELTTTVENKYFESSRGNWNGSFYSNSHYKGGKTLYSTKATESIELNTEYLSEEYGKFIEGIVTSPEVYIIKRSTFKLGSGIPSNSDWRELVENVTVDNSSITRKASVNENLISHQIRINKTGSTNTRKR